MQIEAIYNHGILTFSQPVDFYKQPLKVMVEVPNHVANIPPPQWLKRIDFKAERIPAAKEGSLQARFNEILGQHAKERAGSSVGEDHQMRMEVLWEKYGQ